MEKKDRIVKEILTAKDKLAQAILLNQSGNFNKIITEWENLMCKHKKTNDDIKKEIKENRKLYKEVLKL